jgi:hypothetical protein
VAADVRGEFVNFHETTNQALGTIKVTNVGQGRCSIYGYSGVEFYSGVMVVRSASIWCAAHLGRYR